jgi:hypothetical protein
MVKEMLKEMDFFFLIQSLMSKEGGRNQGIVHYMGMTFGTNHDTIL